MLLFVGFEHAQNTVDRLPGVDGVQRAHDEVAGFGGAQSEFDGFAVAHFADQNDLGRLAKRGTQAAGKLVEVRAHFALIERGLFLRVNEFHGVFEGDDVDGLGFVDLVEEGGQGRGFAGSGGPGHEDEAGLLLRHVVEGVRELEVAEGWDLGVEFAEHDRVVAALGEDVDAETGLAGQRVGGVAGAGAQEIFRQPS